MKVLFLVIAFLFISSTAWGGTWGNIASGIADGLNEAAEEFNSPEARRARAEREYLERQTELEQQLLEQEQQRINTEQQLILQQQWQLFQQQQQQLSHVQLEQKKELRLLQKRQEFIQLYILTTEQATKAESNVTHSNLSVNPSNTIVSSSNKHAFFTTKLSNVYHKPNCSRLVASDGLVRFDTQQKACKAGCLPCNYCKPD
ncbi:MAG: hypothetical protein ACUZ8N_03725 [Candidatus Scalindua sp.]